MQKYKPSANRCWFCDFIWGPSSADPIFATIASPSFHWKERAFFPFALTTYYIEHTSLSQLCYRAGDTHPLPWHFFQPSRGKGQANREWESCEHQTGEWINVDTEHKSGMSQGRFSELHGFYVEAVVRKNKGKNGPCWGGILCKAQEEDMLCSRRMRTRAGQQIQIMKNSHGNWIKYTLAIFSFEEFSYTMKYNRIHEILSKRGAEFLRCHYFQGKDLLTT